MNMQANTTNKTVLILGATGDFGSHLVNQMSGADWQVRALARNADQGAQHNVQWIQGDLEKPATLATAAAGVDVIVHSVNVPYPKWDPLMIEYTKRIIELALSTDAHLLFVGNIYNAGIPESGVITESTPHAPVNEKGEIRATLESMIAEASQRGLRSTIMRFGDFFGPNIKGANWFNIATKNVVKGKLSYMGPGDIAHTWAYLPDAVEACEEVLSVRIANTEQPEHMVLPFAGHVFTFAQLQSVIESELDLLPGKELKIGGQPWTVFRIAGRLIPLMRDIVSMQYLWNHDIRMDGGSLANLLGGAPTHTPLSQAVSSTVPALNEAKRQKEIEQSA